jgi:hypothetical protein
LFRLGTGAVINGAVFDDDVKIQRSRRWGSLLGGHCAHNCQEPSEPKEPSLHYVAGSYRAAISAQKECKAPRYWILRCILAHRFVPCRRLRPRERRDAIPTMRPVAFELGKQIEAGRAKRAARLPQKASGSKGKSEFNERGNI